MSLALWHWHIEISSKCTLRCPRCPRVESPDTLVNTELNLEFFKKNFTPDFIKKNVERITFCGDDGDPIYAHDLVDVIKYFKSIKPVSFTIITNGSHKKQQFWFELAQTLTDIDSVHFSIDGYDNDSNNLYRVNSNFESIMLGAKILRRFSNCYMFWSTIYFKFNQDKIDTITELAKTMGFDYLQLTKSTKFRKFDINYPEDDTLQPDEEYLSSDSVYQRNIISLKNRQYVNYWEHTNQSHFEKTKVIKDKVFPLCHVGTKGTYISSQGYFYPCCWVANRFSYNDSWKDKRYNLHEKPLSEVVNLDIWNEDFIDGSMECFTKCNKNIGYKNFNTRECEIN